MAKWSAVNGVFSSKPLIIGIITTILGAITTFAFGWVHNVDATQSKHTSDIAVLDTKVSRTDKDIDEIKGGQNRIEDKLDKVLEREPHGIRSH